MTEFQKQVSKISYTDFIDPKHISIENMWKLYVATSLVGKTYSRDQYQELQTAFCIGFIESFKLLTDIAAELPEDQACDMFSKIANESNRIADIKLKLKGIV